MHQIVFSLPYPLTVALRVDYAGDKLIGTTYVAADTDGIAKPPAANDAFAQQINYEFNGYFSAKLREFTLATELRAGTVFQQQVWQALTAIPFGEVTTYAALAHALNSSPRAVGNACRQNPLPVVIPCHRVVSSSNIGGYAGDSPGKQKTAINFLAIKQWLLQHEQQAIRKS